MTQKFSGDSLSFRSSGTTHFCHSSTYARTSMRDKNHMSLVRNSYYEVAVETLQNVGRFVVLYRLSL